MSNVSTAPLLTHLSVVTVHIKDQDEALRFYTEVLGFEKRGDAPVGPDMRWVTVAPAGSTVEMSLVSTYDVGAPIGGNTGLVFETADLDAAYEALSGRGVTFTRPPVKESFGGWAEFEDHDGNTFGLHAN